jgi:VanZ family protein
VTDFAHNSRCVSQISRRFSNVCKLGSWTLEFLSEGVPGDRLRRVMARLNRPRLARHRPIQPLSFATATTLPIDGLMRPFRFPWLWRGLGWLMLAIVAFLLVTPRVPDPLDVAHADKIYHVAGFALLAGWASLLFESRRELLLRGLLLVGFGAAMEIVQALLPWRSGDLADLAANTAGVALGIALGFTPFAGALWRLERFVVRRSA